MQIPLSIPFRGATDQQAFIQTPGDAAPPESMENFVIHEPTTDRPRGGKRPGVDRLYPDRLGLGPIQGLRRIVRASSVIGYEPGSRAEMLSAESSLSTGVAGNVFSLESWFALRTLFTVDVATGVPPYGDNGPSSVLVRSCACNADGSLFAAAVSYQSAVTGNTHSRIFLFNGLTGSVIGSVLENTNSSVPPTADQRVFVEQMVFVGNRLYVASMNRVLVYTATPTQFTRIWSNTLGGWAQYVVGMSGSPDAAFLYVAFAGTSRGATMASGVIIEPGLNALCFRSGVMKFRIIDDQPYLVQVQFGEQLPTSSPFYDAPSTSTPPHNYWRWSEHTPMAPRGVIPTCIATCTDGSVVVGHTNTGRGPNASYTSQTTYYRSITKISPEGVLLWQADVDSIRETGDGGYLNDLNIEGGPTVLAIAAGGDESVYVAGRVNKPGSDGRSVWRLRGDDGALIADAQVGAVLQRSITILNGQPVVGVYFNDTWTGAGGQGACAFALDAAELTVDRFLTLPTNVYGVAGGGGRLFIGTDRI